MQPILKTAPAAADTVKDVETAQFMDEVVDASFDQPIIVDFWAPWCGPCKTLGPQLEKAVRETKGAVRMVKVDIDRNQDLAAQMRIQSIPAVYAFKDGRPIDGFVGALPESQIKSFVQRVMQMAGAKPGASPIDEALAQAKQALADGDFQTADAIYAQILEAAPDNVEALAGLGRCLLAEGEVEGARELLSQVPADHAKHADIVALTTAVELAEQAAGAGSATAELEARLARDPDDHQARYDLALALYGAGKREEAVDQLLDLFKRDRAWNEEAARKQLVKLFEAFGFTDPLSVSGRRRLSTLMFA